MYNTIILNVDTDAVFVTKPDQSPWTKEEQQEFLDNINAQFPPLIKMDDDGYYDTALIIASKNYAMLPSGKKDFKIKGSSLRDKKKEIALQEMMSEIVENFLFEKNIPIEDIYHKYIKEVLNITNISRWCQRKSISKSVLNAKGHEMLSAEDKKAEGIRLNETAIWDAVKHRELNQEGDRIHLFPAILGERDEEQEVWRKHPKTKISEFKGTKTVHIIDKGLLLTDKWDGSNHDVKKLLQRVHDTISIFDTVIDMTKILDYNRKENKELLENLK